MPDPSVCNRPLPDPNGPDDKHVDVLRDLIDCMLEYKNGTLVDVFGIEPPYENGYHETGERERERKTNKSKLSDYKMSIQHWMGKKTEIIKQQKICENEVEMKRKQKSINNYSKSINSIA